MPITITMPRLSDTMESGTLIKWRVSEGDKVKSGDVLADVETDKATMELPTYDDGTIAKLVVSEGDSLPVGKAILMLAEEGEDVAEVAKATPQDDASEAPEKGEPEAKAEEAESEPAQKQSSGEASQAAPSSGGRVRISPLAARMAEEHDLDLGAISGSGPEGRIIKRDVLAAIEGGTGGRPSHGAAATPAPKMVAPVKLESKKISVSNMRKTIAKRLVESKTTVPHFTVTVSVNMDPLLALRKTLNEQLEAQGVKLSVNDFIVRGCALALMHHPLLNSSWAGDSIQQHGTINVGVAVALSEEKGGGLVVPTLRDTQTKGLRQISQETRALAKKARESGLSIEEMSDGTFTVSNLGMLGVDHFEAIINPPQAAILAVGAALKKPVVRDGQIVVGSEMTCTLSADHRVVDGAMGAEFLGTLKQMLENPAVLLV